MKLVGRARRERIKGYGMVGFGALETEQNPRGEVIALVYDRASAMKSKYLKREVASFASSGDETAERKLLYSPS